MKKRRLTAVSGQTSLEYVLLVALITVSLVFVVKGFFPGIQGRVKAMRTVIEDVLETGSEFK